MSGRESSFSSIPSRDFGRGGPEGNAGRGTGKDISGTNKSWQSVFSQLLIASLPKRKRPRSWEDLQGDELTVGAARGCLAQAVGVLAKCVHDLGLAQEKDLWQSRDQAHRITVRLYGIVADAREVLAVIGSEGPGTGGPQGPSGQVRPRVATHTRPDVDALVAIRPPVEANRREEVLHR